MTASITVWIAFQTVSALARMSSWFSVHQLTTTPKILMMKLETSLTTLLMTSMIAFQTVITASLNPSFVSQRYLIPITIAAIAATIKAAIPIMGAAAAIIAPMDVPSATAAACKVKNIGTRIPATVTTPPKITINSLTGPGKPLNHSAISLTMFPSASKTGARVSAIAAPSSDIASVTEFCAVLNLSIGSRVASKVLETEPTEFSAASENV